MKVKITLIAAVFVLFGCAGGFALQKWSNMLEERMKMLEERMDKLEERMKMLGEKMDMLEERMKMLEEGMNNIEGKIYTTGNEPFVQLAVETKSGKVYIISKSSPVYNELWKNQGKFVKLEAKRGEKLTGNFEEIFVKSFKIISQ